MSPQEAVEYGIIDRVLEPGEIGREGTKPSTSDISDTNSD
jgi:hypothetical protein